VNICPLPAQVNELNDTVETLQEEITSMRTEVKRFQDDDVKSEESRQQMIKELEVSMCQRCCEIIYLTCLLHTLQEVLYR